MKMFWNAESNAKIKLKSFNYLVKTVRRERTSLSGISTNVLKCFRFVLSVKPFLMSWVKRTRCLHLQQYPVNASNFISWYVLPFQMHLINVIQIKTIIDSHCKIMAHKCRNRTNYLGNSLSNKQVWMLFLNKMRNFAREILDEMRKTQ